MISASASMVLFLVVCAPKRVVAKPEAITFMTTSRLEAVAFKCKIKESVRRIYAWNGYDMSIVKDDGASG